MQKKTVITSLTREEKTLVENFFSLPGWQFDEIIKPNCTEMAEYSITWEHNTRTYAIMYGLKAIKGDTKESCIANYFIRYGSKLYQTKQLETILLIIKALKREEEVSKYWQTFYKAKAEARENARKLKLKQLKLPIKKIA